MIVLLSLRRGQAADVTFIYDNYFPTCYQFVWQIEIELALASGWLRNKDRRLEI